MLKSLKSRRKLEKSQKLRPALTQAGARVRLRAFGFGALRPTLVATREA